MKHVFLAGNIKKLCYKSSLKVHFRHISYVSNILKIRDTSIHPIWKISVIY